MNLQTFRLGDITTKIGSGVTPRGGEKVYQTSGTALIRSQNVYDYHFKTAGLVFVNDNIAEKMKGVTIEENDILLNITGDSVGRSCMVPENILPARVNQHVSIIRGDRSNVNPTYLSYLLNEPKNKERLLNLVHGGTRKALTKGIIENFEVSLPALEEQDHIAHVLRTLDDKIKLNQRMNVTLEDMAMTLYKYWFVDFGPFKGGEFVESEMGVIPKGWKVVSLSDLLILSKKGITPKYTENVGDSIIVINQKCIRDKKLSLLHARRHDLSKRVPVDKYLVPNDILINSTGLGTLGRVAQLFNVPEPMVVDSHVRICRPDSEKSSPIYLGQLLKRLEPTLQTMTEGSTGQAELSSELLNIKVLYPPLNLQKEYEKKVLDWFVLIQKNDKENEELALTRDYLLPRLLSGEIELTEAKKTVEEVL